MRRQSVETPQLPVARWFNYDSTNVTIVVPFRFAAPGPRVMLTVKFLVTVMGQRPPFDWTVNLTTTWSLWLYRSTFTSDGQRVPVQNLLGTRAAPVRLDSGATNDSVNGASIDWTGGGDGVDGELTIGLLSGSGAPGNPLYAFLRGRYNAVAPLCDDEWARVEALAGQSPDVRAPSQLGTG